MKIFCNQRFKWSFIIIMMSWSFCAYNVASSENSLSPGSKDPLVYGFQLDDREKAWLEIHKEIRIGTSQYPPLTYMDDSGAMVGISADYLKHISKRTGLKFEAEYFAWPDLMKQSKNRGIDMFSGLKNPEREKYLNFTSPYLQVSYVVINRIKTPFLGDFSVLNGQKVAVVKDWTVHRLMQKDFLKIKIVPFNSVPEALTAVSNGHVEAYVGDLLTASYQIQKNVLTNLKVAASAPFRNDSVRFAIRKDWPELATILDKTIHSLSREEHESILQKWLQLRFEKGVDWSLVWQWSGGIGSFLCLIIIVIIFRDRNLLLDNEKKLRNSIADLKESVKAGHVGLWNWDLITNEVNYSAEWKKHIGYEEHEISNDFSEWEDRVHPDDLKPTIKIIEKSIKDVNQDHRTEFRFRHKDGSYRWILAQASFIQNEDGHSIRMVGSHLDITDQKQAEDVLKDREEQYRAIVDNIGDYIMRYDKGFKHIYANKLALEATGLPIDQYIGKTHREMGFPDHLCELWRKNIKLVFDTGKQQNVEFDVELALCKKSLELQLNPEFASDGSVKTVIGISRDVTLRKQAEIDKKKLEFHLQQSQKLESIGTLAGGIAHDFNNILSSIIGFSSIALEEVGKGSELEDDLQEIQTAGLRAKDLVKQILTIARQSDEKIQPMRVDTIAREVIKFIRASIPSTIEIKSNIKSESLILANETQVHQVFMNLFTNAAHAMEKDGGILDVCLEEVKLDNTAVLEYPNLESGDYIKITISDSGTGIPQDIMDSIFEPYFTTKGSGEGTGLGLAMVHGIVESYGGTITVSSKLNKGSVFTIYLPVTKKFETHEPKESEFLPKGTEKILLVDDELPILKLTQRILESLGYQVTIKASSIKALELFKSNPNGFDLVLTDMTMPELTGDKLAQTIRDIRHDIPVLLCTGYSKKLSANEETDYKIKADLKKPISQRDLAKTIRKALDGAKVKNE